VKKFCKRRIQFSFPERYRTFQRYKEDAIHTYLLHKICTAATLGNIIKLWCCHWWIFLCYTAATPALNLRHLGIQTINSSSNCTERERERERESHTQTHTHTHMCRDMSLLPSALMETPLISRHLLKLSWLHNSSHNLQSWRNLTHSLKDGWLRLVFLLR
jgi:hypothetical protein